MPRKMNGAGFSLLEVIVALALIGLILVSVFQAVVQTSQFIIRNRNYAQSLTTLQSLTAWWMRLPLEKQRVMETTVYSQIPPECMAVDSVNFEWCIQTENDGMRLIAVRGPQSVVVRLPIGVME